MMHWIEFAELMVLTIGIVVLLFVCRETLSVLCGIRNALERIASQGEIEESVAYGALGRTAMQGEYSTQTSVPQATKPRRAYHGFRS